MITEISPSVLDSRPWFNADRIGVFASVLCALHCALTPFLLLALPAFGRAWSHPASHWGMALFVVPVAALTLMQGFQKHRRRWVVGVGALGISLILVGAAAPYVGEGLAAGEGGVPSADSGFVMAKVSEDDVGGGSMAAGLAAQSSAGGGATEIPCASACESEVQCATAGGDATVAECEDLCCPTLQTTADGGWKLHIPLASILTTLGGLSLIATHLGNLCCCATCSKPSQVT